MGSLFPASLPLLVFITALVLKRGAVVSSLLGILSVGLITYFYRTDYPIDWVAVVLQNSPVVLVLSLSVAWVVFPGQIMNSLLKRTGTIDGIGEVIEAIEISRLKLASIIVLGMAPALESLTGFGVSLFFTVPVLMQLFDLRKALILSLLSMNIMPWGTLALSTLVGAQITELSFSELSYQSSLMSFFIFPTIGFLIYFICRKSSTSQFSQLSYPVLIGFSLSSFLVFYNAYTTPELAGVYAGVSVSIIGFVIELLIFNRRIFFRVKYSPKAIFLLFSPYITLVFLILISRIEAIAFHLHDLFLVKVNHIHLSAFSNPGTFIILTVICLYTSSRKFRRDHAFFLEGIKRAFYPVIGIFMFIVFAQIQRSSGILKTLAAEGAALSLTENVFIAPLIGMISGYTTGSGVSGNVLFMSLQTEIGTYFDEKLLFAAVQNSSAGHAVFMSVPIVLLAFSIAQLDKEEISVYRNWLIRRALGYAPVMYLALIAAFYLSI